MLLNYSQSFYEDDVRYRKCNVCTSDFTCAPPKRVELMESFTGAEIAGLLREGSIVASSPAFSQDIYAKFRTMLPVERELTGLDHWYQGVFFITKVEEQAQEVKVNLTCRSKRDLVLAQFDENFQINLGDKVMELVAEGPLRDCVTKEDFQQAFPNLITPTSVSFKYLTPPNHGDDHIEAVSIVHEKTFSNALQSDVNEAKLAVQRRLKLDAIPDFKISHFIGGPCDQEKLSCAIVFQGHGQGWKLCETLEEALVVAHSQPSHGDIRSGSSVRIQGLKSDSQLNGQVGLALGYDATSKRWGVRVFDGSGKKIKPANLKVEDNMNGQVMCFYGNAVWSRVQLLGEIAR